jgi:hypothetical protein
MFEKETTKKDGQATIMATRTFAKRCWFDRVKTERGRDALVSYHYKWNDERKSFSDIPFHDWSSNGADAFQYLSIAHKFAEIKTKHIIEIPGTYQRDALNQSWMET